MAVPEQDQDRFNAYLKELKGWDFTRPRSDFFQHVRTNLGSAEKDVVAFMLAHHKAFADAVPGWSSRSWRRRRKRHARGVSLPGVTPATEEATNEPSKPGPVPSKRSHHGDAGDNGSDTAKDARIPKRRRGSAENAGLMSTSTPNTSAACLPQVQPRAPPSTAPPCDVSKPSRANATKDNPSAVSAATVAQTKTFTAEACTSRSQYIQVAGVPYAASPVQSKDSQGQRKRQKRAELEETVRTLTTQLDSARGRIALLEPIRDIRDSLALKLKAAKTKHKKTKADRKQLTESLRLKERELSTLALQHGALQAREEQLARECDELSNERDRLRVQCDGLQVEWKGLKATEDRLTKERSAAEAEAKRAKLKLPSLEYEVTSLMVERDAAADRLKTLRADCVKDVEDIEARYGAKFKKLVQEHEAAIKKIEDSYAGMIEALEARHSEAMDAADKSIARSAVQIDGLRSAMAEMIKSHAAETASLGDLKERLHCQAIQLDHIKVAHDRLKTKRDDLNAKVAHLTTERDEVVKELKTAQALVADIQHKHAAQTEETKSHLAGLVVQRDDLKAERDALKINKDGLVAERDAAVTEASKHVTTIKEINAAHNAHLEEVECNLNGELAAVKGRLNAIVTERKSLEVERDKLVQQLAHRTTERDEAAASVSRLASDHAELIAKIGRIKLQHCAEVEDLNGRLTTKGSELVAFMAQQNRINKERDDLVEANARLRKQQADVASDLDAKLAAVVKHERDGRTEMEAFLRKEKEKACADLVEAHNTEIVKRDQQMADVQDELAAMGGERNRLEKAVVHLTKRLQDSIQLEKKQAMMLTETQDAHGIAHEKVQRHLAGVKKGLLATKVERDDVKAERDCLYAATTEQISILDKAVAKLEVINTPNGRIDQPQYRDLQTERGPLSQGVDRDAIATQVKFAGAVARFLRTHGDIVSQLGDAHDAKVADLRKGHLAAIEKIKSTHTEEYAAGVRHLEDTIARLEHDATTQSVALDESRRKIGQLCFQITQLEVDLSQTEEQTQGQTGEQDTTMKAMGAQLALLQQERDDIISNLRCVEATLDAVETDRDSVKTQLAEMTTIHADTLALLDATQQDRADAITDLANLKTRLAECETRLETAPREMGVAAKEQCDLATKLSDVEAPHGQQSTVASLQAMHMAKVERLKQDHLEVLQVWRTRHDVQQRDLHKIKQQRDQLGSNLREIETIFNLTPGTNAVSHCRHVGAELKRLRELAAQKGGTQFQRETINKQPPQTEQYRSLQAEHTGLKQRHFELVNVNRSLVFQHNEAQAICRSAVEERNKTIAEFNVRAEEANRMLTETAKRIQSLTADRTRLQKERSELQSKVITITAELERRVGEHQQQVRDVRAGHASEVLLLRRTIFAWQKGVAGAIGARGRARMNLATATSWQSSAPPRNAVYWHLRRRVLDVLLLVIAYQKRQRPAPERFIAEISHGGEREVVLVDQRNVTAVGAKGALGTHEQGGGQLAAIARQWIEGCLLNQQLVTLSHCSDSVRQVTVPSLPVQRENVGPADQPNVTLKSINDDKIGSLPAAFRTVKDDVYEREKTLKSRQTIASVLRPANDSHARQDEIQSLRNTPESGGRTEGTSMETLQPAVSGRSTNHTPKHATSAKEKRRPIDNHAQQIAHLEQRLSRREKTIQLLETELAALKIDLGEAQTEIERDAQHIIKLEAEIASRDAARETAMAAIRNDATLAEHLKASIRIGSGDGTFQAMAEVLRRTWRTQSSATAQVAGNPLTRPSVPTPSGTPTRSGDAQLAGSTTLRLLAPNQRGTQLKGDGDAARPLRAELQSLVLAPSGAHPRREEARLQGRGMAEERRGKQRNYWVPR